MRYRCFTYKHDVNREHKITFSFLMKKEERNGKKMSQGKEGRAKKPFSTFIPLVFCRFSFFFGKKALKVSFYSHREKEEWRQFSSCSIFYEML